jgi:hypothetical protein
MSQQNNYSKQWPKAFVAIFGTAFISAAAYFLHEPQIMWSMLALIWLISYFD